MSIVEKTDFVAEPGGEEPGEFQNPPAARAFSYQEKKEYRYLFRPAEAGAASSKPLPTLSVQ